MPVSGLGFLQRPPKMLDILVHLLERDETTVSDLLEDLNLSASTYYAAVRRLFELGFVFKREERVFPRHVCIGLTRKGREIAERLRHISEMVESKKGKGEQTNARNSHCPHGPRVHGW